MLLLNSGEPTFETSHGTYTHLDLTICSQNLAPDFTWNVHFENYASDHYPVIIDSLYHSVDPLNFTPKFKLDKADWHNFQNRISIPEAPFPSPSNLSDILEKEILSAAEQSIPKTKGKRNNRPNKHWWNKDCARALKEKKLHTTNIGKI